MLIWSLLLIALFLPLFPFSMVFNAIYRAVNNSLLRWVLLVAWPLAGLYLFQVFTPGIPQWVTIWALLTALLYAFRMLAMREVRIWSGFLATSLFAVLWIPLLGDDDQVIQYSVVLAVPLVLLSILIGEIEKRFGAAYTDLYGGMALTVPVLSGVFVITLLATVATPIFPGFFVLLNILAESRPSVAVTLAGLWVLWSWGAVRIVQGMISGDARDLEKPDLSTLWAWLFSGAAVAYIGFGVKLVGVL